MTDDLFSEIFEERSAICEHDGLLTREAAEAQGKLESEAYRAACEVRYVLAMPLAERRDYLELVAQKRGDNAADTLKGEIQREWLRRKSA